MHDFFLILKNVIKNSIFSPTYAIYEENFKNKTIYKIVQNTFCWNCLLKIMGYFLPIGIIFMAMTNEFKEI